VIARANGTFRVVKRHSGAMLTGPRKARPDGVEPGIHNHRIHVQRQTPARWLWIPGLRQEGASRNDEGGLTAFRTSSR
jgi:hypothetical protein